MMLRYLLAGVASIGIFHVIKNWLYPIVAKLAQFAQKRYKQARLKVVEACLRSLRSLYESLWISVNGNDDHSSLTPTAFADDNHIYEKFLLQSILSKDVLNIGLTGPYGSGKSSIIKTFIRRHPELKFLRISLAALADETQQTDGVNSDENQIGKKRIVYSDDLHEKIQYSILQQVFYHVSSKRVPYSRFKRIRKIPTLSLTLMSLGILLLALSVAYLFLLKDLSILPPGWEMWMKTHVALVKTISWFVLLIATFTIVHSILKLYQHTQLIKLNLNNAELEISPNKDTSVLNKHFDEILYYFSVLPFDVVVIEDLDRFEDPEIFVKLREANNLINNAEYIKQKVTFLYALRDDVFVDENRTKFFDYIIPVIPITNATNASAQLNKSIDKLGLSLGNADTLLNDLGYFIQDKRLLNNIANEVSIYKNLLHGFEVSDTELLAIIVYKNKYPTDFTQLQFGEGKVYRHFSKMPTYIETLLEQFKKEKAEVELKLLALNSSHLKAIKELRLVYLAILFESIYQKDNRFQGKICVIDPYVGQDLSALTEDNNFSKLRKKSGSLNVVSLGGNSTLPISVSEVFNTVSSQSYEQRESVLKGIFSYDKDSLEHRLYQINMHITTIKSYRMSQLMNMPEFAQFETAIKNEPLLVYLIKNGYLNEKYSYYLSQFTEGELSREDFEFVWSVKQGKRLNWDHRLNKLNAVVRRLNPSDYLANGILNIDLADHLITHEIGDNEALTNLFRVLNDRRRVRREEFIDRWRLATKYIGGFIRAVCLHWSDFWDFIEFESNYDLALKQTYATLIVKHVHVDHIKLINSKNTLGRYLSSEPLLLNPTQNNIEAEKIYQIIKELKIEFDLSIPPEDLESQIMEFIYEHNYYKITPVMIDTILKLKIPKYEEDQLQRKQYTTILESNLAQLKGYLESNLTTYVEKVYINIHDNNQEAEFAILTLLNSNISNELKICMIENATFEVSDIDKIESLELLNPLLDAERIQLSWNTVSKYWNRAANAEGSIMGLTPTLVSYLNKPIIAKSLSQTSITEGDGLNANIIKSLIFSNKINEEAYEEYITALGFEILQGNFTSLSESKTAKLVKSGKVIFTRDVYANIKQAHPAIAAEFAVNSWEQFSQLLPELKITHDDAAHILKYGVDKPRQQILVTQLAAEQVSQLLIDGVSISDDILREIKLTVTYDTILSFIDSEFADNGVIVNMISNSTLKLEEVVFILERMGGEFEKLATKKDPELAKSELMIRLLDSLFAADYLVSTYDTVNNMILVKSRDEEAV